MPPQCTDRRDPPAQKATSWQAPIGIGEGQGVPTRQLLGSLTRRHSRRVRRKDLVRLLLDTCTFIWLATDVKSLSSTAQGLLAGLANELFLSPVSTWEMSIKYARRRLDQIGREIIFSGPL